MAFCMKSELDLFSSQPLQTSILKTEEVGYKPISPLEKHPTCIEFVIPSQSDVYKDLSSINLKLKLRLVKDGNGAAIADDSVGVCNNILHSAFRQCSIYLNGKPIAQTDVNYNYRAYIETLLSYGRDASETHLASIGWHLDTGNEHNDYVSGGTATTSTKVGPSLKNNGLTARRAKFAKSVVVELQGRLHCDLFNQQRLLLNNVEMKIVLAVEKPEFCLMEGDDQTSQLEFIDACLYVNHVTVNPQIMLLNETTLNRGVTAKYNYQRCEVKTYTIGAGAKNFSLDNIVIGSLPNLLIFGIVTNAAYTGKRSLNPFNFKHFNMNKFNLVVNGMTVPTEPLTFNFKTTPPLCSRGYRALFKDLNIWTNAGHQINENFYANGSFLLIFDLTNDQSYGTSDCGNLINTGVIRAEADFDENIPESLTCIVYSAYDTTLEIDKDRNVMTNY